ncbi:MAG: hypothetical protein K0R29_1708 [Pseudobdellovibrio sp.]|jgi:HEAT repeat protein|nr:hypothetical protein [Pseudobdellovibrio sp.]
MKNKITFAVLLLAGLHATAAIENFSDYMKIVKNEKATMNVRWRALMQSTELAKDSDVDEIRSFVESKEWYLRNAALVALKKVDPARAEIEAVKLLSDKALVVRSAAVEIVAQNMNENNKKVLIQEVDKGYNFNKASSLWIRRQILEKVARVATDKDQNVFVKNLFDPDKKISELCANTLERLTGKKMARKKFVENWRQYAKQENWF